MSSQIGTLQQRPRFGHLVVPAVAIALLAAVAIVTTNVVLDRGESAGSSDRRAVDAGSARMSATADAYLGSQVIATDGARWTAAAEAYGALQAPAVLGITTPSELRSFFDGQAPAVLGITTPSELRSFFDGTTEAESGNGRRGVTPRVGPETGSPDRAGTVGGDTGAAHHPLP